TDIATYQVQVREGAGAWVDLACCSSTTSASTSFVGQDGHSYGFRSIARDRAGNIEIAPPGNDTSTTVDIRSPFVTDVAPLGANTNLTPWVIVTFSEPMDRNSVALAFSITPAMNGAYQWSADSTQLTFIPARALNAGTTYAITVDSSAKDRAGNPMTQSRTFQFSTAGGGLTGGFSVGEYWWLLAVVGAVAGGTVFMVLRRRGSAAKAPPAAARARTGTWPSRECSRRIWRSSSQADRCRRTREFTAGTRFGTQGVLRSSQQDGFPSAAIPRLELHSPLRHRSRIFPVVAGSIPLA